MGEFFFNFEKEVLHCNFDKLRLQVIQDAASQTEESGDTEKPVQS